MVAGPFDTGLLILFIAVMIEVIVQTEARMLDDGGFYEEGVFGYDFSEGYTSLEGSTAQGSPNPRECPERLASTPLRRPSPAASRPRGR